MEAETYLKLKTCLELLNVDLFESSLEMFVYNLIHSIVTKEFGEYFATYMVPIRQKWRYCYRAGDGIKTNMFVEAFHHNLKYNYSHGKHNKHVDNFLRNLLKFSRDQVFEWLIRLTKGKQTMRQKHA